jgi:hypothetical protein
MSFQKKSSPTFIQFLTIAVVGVLLLITAHLASSQVAEQQKQFAELLGNILHRRTVLSMAVSIALMIPAFCLFIVQHRQGPSTLWRAFWTVSFAAFAVHLYWGVKLMKELDDWTLVSSFVFDTIVVSWWIVDILLSWLPGKPGASINGLGASPQVSMLRTTLIKEQPPFPGARWVRAQRSLLHVVMFIAMVMASIPQGQGIVKVLGVVLVISVLAAVALRVVIRPFNPDALSGKAYKLFFSILNKWVPWHGMPTAAAIVNLGALRETLRAENLHTTSEIPVSNPLGLIDGGNAPLPNPTDLTERRSDGCYNDLDKPNMGRGSATTDPSGDAMLHDLSHPCARFGRNVPLTHAFPDTGNLMNPNPRLISRELLAREEFKPAKILNLLAAAWIQFQTHDWFNHGEPIAQCPFKVPPVNGDDWPGEMHVKQTRPDPTRDYDKERRESSTGELLHPPTYVNAESHWWDASQIYGASARHSEILRRDPKSADGQLLPFGKMQMTSDGKLPLDPSDPQGLAMSGFVGNWWVGLSLLHNVFVREHNAICDRLAGAYASWDGDRIYATARMINAALMAKIHTVEWTTAILQNPALQIGMNANWWGLVTKGFTNTFGRISPTEAFSGIPNSGVDHHGVDFTLTEEFVSVYRLHPLMPDEFKLYSNADGRFIQRFEFPDGMLGPERELFHNAPGKVDKPITLVDVFYSFGRAFPGAVTLHNYPNYLRKLTRESIGPTVAGKKQLTEETIDLATIEIIRDRERGVPRYNEFRRQIHMPPIKSFDDLDHAQPGTAQKLRRIYGTKNGVDNVELVDLMVGMYAEVPPEGFGFSDTAFRVFILMASRRIKSDRFLAQGYNADVFTQEGIDWIEENSMLTILKRHFPELAPALYSVTNAFVPWVNVNQNGA